MYPIAIFDALRVKFHDADSCMAKNKAFYVALGISRDGDMTDCPVAVASSLTLSLTAKIAWVANLGGFATDRLGVNRV